MSFFAVPPEVASLLGRLTDTTEIRDPQGNLLGTFTPRKVAGEAHWEHLRGLFDLKEAERVLATEKEGRPLRDILRDLQATQERGDELTQEVPERARPA
jgi:hypothetical protein